MDAAIADYETTFEYEGENIPCVRRDQASGIELQDVGGYVDGENYTLLVAKSHFANALEFPKVGELVDNDTAQIKRIEGDENPQAVQFILYIGGVDN